MHTRLHSIAAKALLALALVGTPTLAPSLAWANEGQAAHGDGWMNLVYQTINLVVLVAILIYFARKPIGEFTSSAARQAKEAADALKAAEAEAAKALEAEKQGLANLKKDIDHMLADVKAEAQKERERVLAEAQAVAATLVTQARASVDMERNKAMIQLRAELADATLEAAEKIIREKMNEGAQKTLVNQHIKHLEAAS